MIEDNGQTDPTQPFSDNNGCTKASIMPAPDTATGSRSINQTWQFRDKVLTPGKEKGTGTINEKQSERKVYLSPFISFKIWGTASIGSIL